MKNIPRRWSFRVVNRPGGEPSGGWTIRGVNRPGGEHSGGWTFRGVNFPGVETSGDETSWVKPWEGWIIRRGEKKLYKGVNSSGVNHESGETSGIQIDMSLARKDPCVRMYARCCLCVCTYHNFVCVCMYHNRVCVWMWSLRSTVIYA